MKNLFSYQSLNIFFSVLGIYVSYFYFGSIIYFYPSFEFNSIIITSIGISLFVLGVFLITKYLLQRINISIIVNFFNAISFAATIYITYHYLIKFSDFNYYHIFNQLIGINNLFIKILFYLYPFIISFCFFFIISKKKINNIQKFLFILLIILNFLSLIRLNEIYSDNKNQFILKHDYNNFTLSNDKEIILNKKIFFIIFDEFDQGYLIKNINKLPNFKKLYDSSYVNKNFYPPAKFTLDSIPAILTGSSTKKTIIKKGNLSIISNENKKIDFNFENSIFNEVKKNKLTSSIYGFYHPYCKIFKVKICYDNFKLKQDINLNTIVKILLEVTYIEKFIPTTFLFKDPSNVKDLEKRIANISKVMINNSSSFVNSNTDLIYIHYPFPHSPLQTKGIINFNEDFKNLTDHEKNLQLVDFTLENIIESLSKIENSLLIITGDHWERKKNLNRTKPYKMVFLSKIIGDNDFYENKGSNNASSIKKLIIEYLNGNVTGNLDIKKFFLNETNHQIFIPY